MTHIDNLDDTDIKRILTQTRVIALVGASPKPERASHRVGTYLAERGYKVIPVNPGQAGKTLFGQTCVASLSDIDEPVDMIDIFRRSEHVPPIVETAIATFPDTLRTIWMQIGVTNAEATECAEAAGLTVIQDRCPKIEYQRLFGELRIGGFATGVIRSKL